MINSMMIKKFLRMVPFLITVFFITDCAHGQKEGTILTKVFKGTELIPDDSSRICIVEITNRSTIDELAGMLKSELKRRVNSGGRLYMTDDMNMCEAKVRIALLPIKTEPLKFNASGIPEEKRIRIDALVTMEHASTGEEVITNRDIYAYHTYRVAGKGSVSEYRGITGLTEKLSGKIISVMTTGWYKKDNLKGSGRQN